jgi:hypothetical protein
MHGIFVSVFSSKVPTQSIFRNLNLLRIQSLISLEIQRTRSLCFDTVDGEKMFFWKQDKNLKLIWLIFSDPAKGSDPDPQHSRKDRTCVLKLFFYLYFIYNRFNFIMNSTL